MQEHEYTLLGGYNRAYVGRHLAIISAAISAAVILMLLWLVDLAERLGLPANIPPAVLSLASAGFIFTVLYWLFNRYAWRWPLIMRLLGVPDLSGTWKCHGKSLDQKGRIAHEWTGTITIVQRWEKIRLRLKTEKSGSNSVAAALLRDEVDGYKLLYHYKNDPLASQPQLTSHRGFAELVFTKNLTEADGEYFNGQTRFTFGSMHLERL
ncbi:hypothetical protein [Falsiroseomonas sp.]|uniref:Cap15 family cyclic dinucleotide receptor domain-containing protein n=1 Tax=Falsiroseomonas sp. TaxID=2870721 RepID=UPI0027204D0D|nr:hypothetical protein [Falsiroseomonas sp.]MDO9501064.1 hypothetical protein [Falsiroseomonas sp.]